jgi:arylsulfatase
MTTTIVVFASDNGPYGEAAREFGNQGTPDMGNSGPFRGELGEVTEGSIRTAAIIRWPAKVKPNTTAYAMFSIMDFLPTFASIIGGKMPADRPIDGVDQTEVLLGTSTMGRRESLLSFIGADLVAARWKQWRIYFTDVHPTGIGPQRQPGIFSGSGQMAGYPKVYNIEMDPHEDLSSPACSAGSQARRLRWSRSIWSRSGSIRIHPRRISRASNLD